MKKIKIIYLIVPLILVLTIVSEGYSLRRTISLNVDVTPSTVSADGNAQANISVQLLGRYNQPLANRTIYFSKQEVYLLQLKL